MISSDPSPFSAAELPARADVVVIGGGIVGVSAALHLAKKGVSVALCEKGRIAGAGRWAATPPKYRSPSRAFAYGPA